MGGKSSRASNPNLREFILNNALFVAIAAAVVALATFAFVTDAPAYAGTAPATCANCHVMDSMYENYYHAGHHAFAVCAECHLPHDNVVTYYVEKGRQGMHDVLVFGTAQTPQVIQLSPRSKAIVQQNCVRCHESAVESIMVGVQPFERDCWECHRSVAHGPRGASVVPFQDSSLYPSKHGE
jgi:cytochrome c nitrite reductase small subunit